MAVEITGCNRNYKGWWVKLVRPQNGGPPKYRAGWCENGRMIFAVDECQVTAQNEVEKEMERLRDRGF